MRHTDDELAANSSPPQFPEFLQNAGRRSFLGSLATFLLVAGQACRRAVEPAREITVVLIDQTWLDRSFQERRNLELEQFTKETGIRVKLLPSPEGAVETLDTWRSLLESGAKIPDVYALDVIWPGILAENLLDLKAFVPAQEVASHFPGNWPSIGKSRTLGGNHITVRRGHIQRVGCVQHLASRTGGFHAQLGDFAFWRAYPRVNHQGPV